MGSSSDLDHAALCPPAKPLLTRVLTFYHDALPKRQLVLEICIEGRNANTSAAGAGGYRDEI